MTLLQDKLIDSYCSDENMNKHVIRVAYCKQVMHLE